MDVPLAIITQYVGTRSETFIRRHCQDLLPGRIAVVGHALRAEETDWNVRGPVLNIRPIRLQMLLRATGPLARMLPRAERLNPLRHFLRKHGVEVIMGEYLDTSLPFLEMARQMGLRFFAHAHGYDVSARLRDRRWRTEYLRYNQSAGIITMSRVSKARLVELGLETAKVHVIPYGVDVPPEPPACPQRNGSVRCLAVGRMVPKKGPLLTLEAFGRAAQVSPNLKLDYIGGGALLPAARRFVQETDLQGRVSLHGSQPNHVVQRAMREADIFVQHSIIDPETGDEEGLPVAVLEAMAHGLPVVATRHAGIPEAVSDGVSGYLVDEGDTESMAERLVALAQAPDDRRRMGLAGWSRAGERFSWPRERADLLSLLGLEAYLR